VTQPTAARARLRLLLVEDSPDDAILVLDELERGGFGFETVRVDTVDELRSALCQEPRWSLLISDWRLPGFTALDVLRIARECVPRTPLIIVSGTIDEESAVEALRAGAKDFVLKDRMARLVPAVRRELDEAAVRDDAANLRDRLAVSERMASMGLLAAGVAHEIKNPLAAVIANLEIAQAVQSVIDRLRDKLDGQASAVLPPELDDDLQLARDALSDALEASERIRDIVRDVQLFTGTVGDGLSPTDVHAVLESSLRLAQTEIRGRATPVKNYGPIPLAQAHAARLGQVFLNLIINAAQAIPEGDPSANTIRLSTWRAQGGRVVVEVEDTGVGIQPESLQRVFEPFFTTKPVGVGTGLGLPICRTIVQTFGGELTVASEPGRGSRFRLSIPAAEAALPPPVVTAVPHQPRRSRILIVDDDAVLARSIERQLRLAHEVVCTCSAREALQLLTGEHSFDVVICDLLMPEMHGFELHRRVRQLDARMADAMIFMTGASAPSAPDQQDPEASRCIRLEKPFDRGALLAAIEHVIARAPSAEPD
jgi:signal transduction histidine kinase